MICHRDVSVESRGAGEFGRPFFGKRHWLLDITYRVQNNLLTYNRLMDPMELSAAQVDEYMNRPRKGKAEGFSFPEDLLPACTQVDSSIPLIAAEKLFVGVPSQWWQLHSPEETVGLFSGNTGT